MAHLYWINWIRPGTIPKCMHHPMLTMAQYFVQACLAHASGSATWAAPPMVPASMLVSRLAARSMASMLSAQPRAAAAAVSPPSTRGSSAAATAAASVVQPGPAAASPPFLHKTAEQRKRTLASSERPKASDGAVITPPVGSSVRPMTSGSAAGGVFSPRHGVPERSTAAVLSPRYGGPARVAAAAADAPSPRPRGLTAKGVDSYSHQFQARRLGRRATTSAAPTSIYPSVGGLAPGSACHTAHARRRGDLDLLSSGQALSERYARQLARTATGGNDSEEEEEEECLGDPQQGCRESVRSTPQQTVIGICSHGLLVSADDGRRGRGSAFTSSWAGDWAAGPTSSHLSAGAGGGGALSKLEGQLRALQAKRMAWADRTPAPSRPSTSSGQRVQPEEEEEEEGLSSAAPRQQQQKHGIGSLLALARLGAPSALLPTAAAPRERAQRSDGNAMAADASLPAGLMNSPPMSGAVMSGSMSGLQPLYAAEASPPTATPLAAGGHQQPWLAVEATTLPAAIASSAAVAAGQHHHRAAMREMLKANSDGLPSAWFLQRDSDDEDSEGSAAARGALLSAMQRPPAMAAGLRQQRDSDDDDGGDSEADVAAAGRALPAQRLSGGCSLQRPVSVNHGDESDSRGGSGENPMIARGGVEPGYTGSHSDEDGAPPFAAWLRGVSRGGSRGPGRLQVPAVRGRLKPAQECRHESSSLKAANDALVRAGLGRGASEG